MRAARRSSLVVLALLFGLVLVGPFAADVARADKGELDEKAMKKKMNGWARDVGVKCSYCHVSKGSSLDYEAESPNKACAHYCEERFVERLKIEDGGKMRPVTCADCHDKQPKMLPGHAAAPAPGTEGPRR